jgi:hypothetical protein
MVVSKLTFIRMCAVGAILAGALRAISSFVPDTTSKVYILYFAIDLFLLFGVVGLHRSSITEGKILGLVGFVLMVLALLLLIARDVGVIAAGAYAAGAGLFSVGLDLFAIQVLRTRQIPSWIPIGWIVSTVVGPIGFFVPSMHLFFALSGLLFGIAFAGAGVAMWNLISKRGTNSSPRL